MITAKSKNKHIDELHFEHQLWVSEIKFYTDELKIYQQRLGEIAIKNPNTEINKQIEHFQNQFIIQKNELDMLNHEITVHEEWLAECALKNPTAIDEEFFADHKVMREQMDRFQKIYTDLKNEFKNFLRQRV